MFTYKPTPFSARGKLAQSLDAVKPGSKARAVCSLFDLAQ
jgi:hypothetical protein